MGTQEMPLQLLSHPGQGEIPGELESPTQLGRGKEESKNTQLALPSSRDKNQQRRKNLSFPPILAKRLLQTATI